MTATPRIGVVIPIGPSAHHATWLRECIASVVAQTVQPRAVLLVDDMHGLRWAGGHTHNRALHMTTLTGQRVGIVESIAPSALDTVAAPIQPPDDTYIWHPPWRLGVTGAFNCGVAMLHRMGCDLALMLGADDVLQPGVIEAVGATYVAEGGRDGYYWCDVLYQSGEWQALPCNNAAVTPGFWATTGGMPVDASSGAMDAALISAMLVHSPQSLIHVTGKDAAFWSRQHDGQETGRMNAYMAANMIIRDVFTRQYRPVTWGRN